MRTNHVKELLKRGEPALGAWLNLPSTSSARLMARLGFDWLLIDMEHTAQHPGLTADMIATIADRKAVQAVKTKGLKAGDPFDMEVGGLADESAGAPVRVTGTISLVVHAFGRDWVSVAFGKNNLVVLSEYLTQVMYPADIAGFGADTFKVFAIKSRVHFRRGFDDSGFARTILLVEPEQPFLGTVRLDALPYKNVDVRKYYPYGDVSFP